MMTMLRDLTVATGATLSGIGIGWWLAHNDPTVILGRIERPVVEFTLRVVGGVVDAYTERRWAR